MAIMTIKSISELHRFLGFEPPVHPLITIFNWEDVQLETKEELTFSLEFYMVSQKEISCGPLKYGRGSYDFDEGTLMFVAPGQVIRGSITAEPSGWVLLFHPDLIRKTDLAGKMSKYSFFNYDTNEALHLSEQEKSAVAGVVEQIRHEYSRPIDSFTGSVIVSQLDLLFTYATRFYSRQFATRAAHNSDIISRFESVLNSYFDSEEPQTRGLPTVKLCAERLGLSPDYLSDMLKKETGKNAQEQIHYALIDRAKTELLSSSHSVSEIAYSLGFEYPQYFSKLFKKKTGLSPAHFRKN